MDNERAWMYEHWHRPPKWGLQSEYVNGVADFLKYASASENAQLAGVIRCPCKKYRNRWFKNIDEVHLHLLKNGFVPRYYTWTCHGEEIVSVPQNVRQHIPNQPSSLGVTPSQTKVAVNSSEHMDNDIAGPSFNSPKPELKQPKEEMVYDVAGPSLNASGPKLIQPKEEMAARNEEMTSCGVKKRRVLFK